MVELSLRVGVSIFYKKPESKILWALKCSYELLRFILLLFLFLVIQVSRGYRSYLNQWSWLCSSNTLSALKFECHIASSPMKYHSSFLCFPTTCKSRIHPSFIGYTKHNRLGWARLGWEAELYYTEKALGSAILVIYTLHLSSIYSCLFIPHLDSCFEIRLHFLLSVSISTY